MSERNIKEKNKEKALSVTFANFITNESMNWVELFTKKDGSYYDRLFILSFTSEISFIDQVSDLIKEKVNIILGCEPLIKLATREMILLDKLVIDNLMIINNINKRPKLQEKIFNGKVEMKALINIISHNKIYILDDKLQNTRVIVASANATCNAFKGNQLESFTVFDNDINAYDSYMDLFETLDKDSTYDIDTKCIISSQIIKPSQNSEENINQINSSSNDDIQKENVEEDNEIDIENLPISKKIYTHKAGILLSESQNIEQTEYLTEYTRASKLLPKVEISFVKDKGKTLVIPDKFIEYTKKIKNAYIEMKGKDRSIKKFQIDYDNNIVFYDNKPFALETQKENVKKDIENLFNYFDGFSQFIGTAEDIKNAKEDYFKILNIMFSSVFIPKLRHDAVENDIWHWQYPIFTVIVGKKSAGKSNFVETINQMMFMKKITQIPVDLFTESKIKSIMCNGSGRPLFIDELKNERFNSHSGEIIKTREQDSLMPELDNHPTFIIASNDIVPFKPEIAKRACYFKINISLTNAKARELNQQVKKMRKTLTNNFYKEYLKRMIPKINDMLKSFTDINTSLDEKDIFKISSDTICDIIDEFGLSKPEYIKRLNFCDYFENNDINTEVKEKILRDIKNNKKAFKVNRKENKLIYIAGEKAYEARRICDSLPENLLAFVSGVSVVMELDKAEQFLNYKFKHLFFF